MRELRVIRAGLVPYGTAFEWQHALRAGRVAGEIPDVLLLLEHPHVYTLGRKFKKEHLLIAPEFLRSRGIEVFETDRGGSITYHGPGQLVGYPILDLRREDAPKEHPDSIKYLRTLEQAIILTLRSFGIVAGRREEMTGVWIGDQKIASIGVNISKGVSKHGFAVNVHTDLSYFEGMVPCGLEHVVMTSVEQVLRRRVAIESVERVIAKNLAGLLHRRIVDSTLADVGILAQGDDIPDAKIASQADVIPFPRTSSG